MHRALASPGNYSLPLPPPPPSQQPSPQGTAGCLEGHTRRFHTCLGSTGEQYPTCCACFSNSAPDFPPFGALAVLGRAEAAPPMPPVPQLQPARPRLPHAPSHAAGATQPGPPSWTELHFPLKPQTCHLQGCGQGMGHPEATKPGWVVSGICGAAKPAAWAQALLAARAGAPWGTSQ